MNASRRPTAVARAAQQVADVDAPRGRGVETRRAAGGSEVRAAAPDGGVLVLISSPSALADQGSSSPSSSSQSVPSSSNRPARVTAVRDSVEQRRLVSLGSPKNGRPVRV